VPYFALPPSLERHLEAIRTDDPEATRLVNAVMANMHEDYVPSDSDLPKALAEECRSPKPDSRF
jgi:hypothetical protein